MADRSIRPAERGDAAVVRNLVRMAYSKYVERIGKEPAPMLEDYDALIRAGELLRRGPRFFCGWPGPVDLQA
jgi:hypothetical protein